MDFSIEDSVVNQGESLKKRDGKRQQQQQQHPLHVSRLLVSIHLHKTQPNIQRPYLDTCTHKREKIISKNNFFFFFCFSIIIIICYLLFDLFYYISLARSRLSGGAQQPKENDIMKKKKNKLPTVTTPYGLSFWSCFDPPFFLSFKLKK